MTNPNLTPAQKEVLTADFLLSSERLLGTTTRARLGEVCQLLLAVTRGDEVSKVDAMGNLDTLADTENVEVFIAGYFEYLKRVDFDVADPLFAQKAAAIHRYNEVFASLIKGIDFDNEPFSSGSFSSAYKLEVDGVTYVVRRASPEDSMTQVEQHVAASLKVTDIDRLEHIEAISYKDGITVAPLLPGEMLIEFRSPANVQHITELQLRELYNAMKQGNERGVGFDGYGGNILYDKEYGFSVIDMEELNEWTTAPRALLAQLEEMVNSNFEIPEFMYQLDRIITVVESILTEDPDAAISLPKLHYIWLMLMTNIEQAESWLNYPKSERNH